MKNFNKYTLIVLLLIFSSVQLNAQSESLLKLMDKIEDGDGVTSVLITQKMFELFAKTTDIEVEGESLNEVISGLKELKIYEIDLSESALFSAVNFDNITAILNKDGYEILLKIKDDGDNVEIYILENEGLVKHLFLIAEDGEDIQLISLLGDIDLEKISKLSGTLNIDELKHLDKK